MRPKSAGVTLGSCRCEDNSALPAFGPVLALGKLPGSKFGGITDANEQRRQTCADLFHLVAAITLAYVSYEDIGLLGHAKATPAAQSDADDD